MAQLTPMTVRALWDYLERRYNSEVVDKRRAPEMWAAAWFVKRFAKIPVGVFMSRYATTIGRRIYVPFTIGQPEPGFPLWTQCLLAVHEHQHIEQVKRHGWFRFVLRYLGSSRARSMFEADAYRTALELEHWRSGTILSPALYASKLRDYGASADDIKAAEQILISTARSIKRGAIITPAAKIAIAWLNEHAPDLKHRSESN